MKKNWKRKIMSLILMMTLVIPVFSQGNRQNRPDRKPPDGKTQKAPQELYTLDQALSEKAQLSTIAFSGLAFITGSFGADTFFPPGKTADYFGFQYMRDIDAAEAGHNMMFLTTIAFAVQDLLMEEQMNRLKDLAREQENLFISLAEKRWKLIRSFRDNMEGEKGGLSREAVEDYTAEIFKIDGELANGRANLYVQLARSLREEQKEAMKDWTFGDSSTWPECDPRRKNPDRSLTHRQQVLVMTYASEFFSWYAGTEESDVYFCPERHGTYFGGFYMKDYPAIGNADYFIPTDLTGNSGKAFLEGLTDEQRDLILSRIPEWLGLVARMADIRRQISQEFRAPLEESLLPGREVEVNRDVEIDKEEVLLLSREYGRLDGGYSWLMADAFARIYADLSPEQREKFTELRNQDVFPDGIYLYAEEVPVPEFLDTSSFFEVEE